MITKKELIALGFPNDESILSLALKLGNIAEHQGKNIHNICAELSMLLVTPTACISHGPFTELAQLVAKKYPNGLTYSPPTKTASWHQWGNIAVEAEAIQQMHNACSLPNAIQGALMPDAHTGYGLPIGGVLAVKNAVIPYAVGVDIACRMRLSILDLPLSTLISKKDLLIEALETETRFGVGAAFEGKNTREHPILDTNWNITKFIQSLHEKAIKQLGTSGGGNHFVEFGAITLKYADLGLAPGSYLALLSHSGSRGIGEAIAKKYSSLAMHLHPYLPTAIKHLAWLEMDSADGQEYWHAMELMGKFAAANHECIHHHILKHIGATPLVHVENHHNFAWKETLNGSPVIIHRKGATPANQGVLGIIPGSMGTPGFVVRGKGNALALNSCSHGAGRIVSRTEANQRFTHSAIMQFLKEKGVTLLSGGLDEAPMAYKDIHLVMEAQKDLVEVVAEFTPRLVKMAPAEPRRYKKKKNK